MKRYFLLLLLTVITSYFFAQSKEDKIQTAIMDYVTGTSYNDVEQIKKAFYSEANLYLDGKDNSMRVLPIGEYIKFFDNSKKGQFTGRVGRIISIDHFGNIAQAKVEILIPSRNLKYIDMFILKIVNGEWKIISKTANSEQTKNIGEKILIVVSNSHFHGESGINTGNSFAEIVYSYDVFVKEGYTVDFVSPKGGAVPLAYILTSDTLQKQYLYDSDFMYALKNTNTPDKIDSEEYKAIYYCGGGSAMYDVPINKEIQEIAMNIYEENEGVISSVCHGTAGIVNLKTKDGKSVFAGKKVSGYPDEYENTEYRYYKEFPFHIQETIEANGGTFLYSAPNTPHVEVDGRLVTGQNHLSASQVAEEIVKIIKMKDSKM